MKNIHTLSLMLLAIFALPSQAASLTVSDFKEGTMALLSTTGNKTHDDINVASILWTYEVTLDDAEKAGKKTATAVRSTKAEYLVDCAKQTIALSKWQMFTNADGKGNMIWTDQAHGEKDFYQPVRNAERSLVSATCDLKTALQ